MGADRGRQERLGPLSVLVRLLQDRPPHAPLRVPAEAAGASQALECPQGVGLLQGEARGARRSV